MNSNVIQSLNEIIEETISYQELINDEKWDELDNQLKNRQSKLEGILANPIEEEFKDNVITQLGKVANLDKEYQSQLEANRKESTSNVLVFRRKHNAARAYKSTENN